MTYHNGGIEGQGLTDWFDQTLGQQQCDTGSGNGQTVLDLSNAGAARIINQSTDANGKISGTVEFLDQNGQPVGWGHFGGVEQVIPSADMTSQYYTVDDLTVLGEHGPGMPPKVALDDFLSEEDCDQDDDDQDDHLI